MRPFTLSLSSWCRLSLVEGLVASVRPTSAEVRLCPNIRLRPSTSVTFLVTLPVGAEMKECFFYRRGVGRRCTWFFVACCPKVVNAGRDTLPSWWPFVMTIAYTSKVPYAVQRHASTSTSVLVLLSSIGKTSSFFIQLNICYFCSRQSWVVSRVSHHCVSLKFSTYWCTY